MPETEMNAKESIDRNAASGGRGGGEGPTTLQTEAYSELGKASRGGASDTARAAGAAVGQPSTIDFDAPPEKGKPAGP